MKFLKKMNDMQVEGALYGMIIMLVFIFIGLLVVGAPFAFLWALNVVFGLSIQYGFLQWIAVWILWFCWPKTIRVQNS